MTAPESSLEDVVALLETERRRVPTEAPWELTKAYAQLYIANGFARVGRADRGRELVASAQDVLTPLCKRERVAGVRAGGERLGVHGYLCEVLQQRFVDASAHRPRTTRLPRALVEAHDGLDRVAQYKVNRLAELTQTVSPDGRTGSIDAAGAWIHRRPIRFAQDPLRELEPTARAENIEAELGRTLVDAEQLALLAAFAELPLAAVDRVLGSVIERAGRGGPTVQATAAFVAVRFGCPELATSVFEKLKQTTEAPLDAADLVAFLPPLLRAGRWMHRESELVPLLERIWTTLPRDANTLGTRMIVAAGLSVESSDLRASNLVDDELEALSTVVQPERLLRIKPIAAGATHVVPALGREILRRLGLRLWRMTTDSYGTNSHFCISVLQLVETLVLAYVDLTLANINVIDPEQQAMLTSGFAL